MLLTAKALLLTKDYETGKQKGILDGLNQYFVHQEGFNLTIYKNFARTQDLRQEVDYQAQDYISEEIALEKMEECEEFIAECEKFFNKYKYYFYSYSIDMKIQEKKMIITVQMENSTMNTQQHKTREHTIY